MLRLNILYLSEYHQINVSQSWNVCLIDQMLVRIRVKEILFSQTSILCLETTRIFLIQTEFICIEDLCLWIYKYLFKTDGSKLKK